MTSACKLTRIIISLLLCFLSNLVLEVANFIIPTITTIAVIVIKTSKIVGNKDKLLMLSTNKSFGILALKLILYKNSYAVCLG